MPTTLEALLIAFFAISPGFLGERVYNALVGADWREKDWQRILRLVLFSTIGLALYVVSGRLFGWPPPIYVFPNSFNSGAISPDTVHLLFLPYLGHCVGATLVGFLAAVSCRLLGRWSLFQSPYPAVWDEFLRSYAPKHWVVITLTNGDVYAGFIKSADKSVAFDERDIVLAEPAQYDEEKKTYLAARYQYLFIPATMVSLIAVIYRSDIDTSRVTEVGKPIFEEGEKDA